eukprot:40080-Amorphochlora_amoeboformis.AAC.1
MATHECGYGYDTEGMDGYSNGMATHECGYGMTMRVWMASLYGYGNEDMGMGIPMEWVPLWYGCSFGHGEGHDNGMRADVKDMTTVYVRI